MDHLWKSEGPAGNQRLQRAEQVGGVRLSLVQLHDDVVFSALHHPAAANPPARDAGEVVTIVGTRHMGQTMRMRTVLLISAAVVVGGLSLMAQVKDLRPTQVMTYSSVTEQMLRNPPPGEWLNWRRTDNNWGYSTLTEINKSNVGQMQLAWSWAMDDTGANEATPLVHDGVMYLPNPRGVIQALDAATGDLIWQYRPQIARPPARAAVAGGGEQTAIPRL